LATQYKVTDDLKLGFVYRSRINHHIEGDLEAESRGTVAPGAAPRNGPASAKLVLPSSITMGANYDFTKRFRGGVSLPWTEWSTIDHIDFCLPKTIKGEDTSYTEELKWRNAWRTGFGFEYDITDSFAGRIGYTYDMDPANKKKGTTMLPSGDRHIIGFGASYRFLEDWRIDLGYSFIIMESETRVVHAENGPVGGNYRFQSDNSYSHLISASVAYTF
jgi:long-chain fatty acid transport protein